MKMSVGRVLSIVTVVLPRASGAFLALSFATGGTVREVTGKMFLYFALLALLPRSKLGRPTAPGSPGQAHRDGAPAHRP